jgi:hypothetical protein
MIAAKQTLSGAHVSYERRHQVPSTEDLVLEEKEIIQNNKAKVARYRMMRFAVFLP